MRPNWPKQASLAQKTCTGEELNKHSCFRSDPIVCLMLVSCSPCNHVQFMRQ